MPRPATSTPRKSGSPRRSAEIRAKGSRRLVIDASVARAASGAVAVFPLSKQCRDFLRTTLTARHCVVLTRAVREEWNKHQSAFALQWRTSMMARKSVVLDDPGEDAKLRASLEMAARTPAGRSAILKDAHLLEAALATDRTVVSLDETARGLFRKAAAQVSALKTVVWVNPGRKNEACVAWLEDGAPAEKLRLLGV